MNKELPVGLFAAFAALLVGATLYFQPSWGLMDDYQNLIQARDVWHAANPLAAMISNWSGGGVYRPFYFTWIPIFYQIFKGSPTGFYIFNIIWNMTAMLLWGLVLFRTFKVRPDGFYWTVFFFPLTFFIFTAYWNIFNYISLQEKFVLLFGAIAILILENAYRSFRWPYVAWLFLVVVLGLCSKATFIFIPMIFLAYALLDLALFHYRPKVSWISLVFNGLIFALYAFFTVTVQLNQNYTQRYKSSLGVAAVVQKLIQAPFVMKFMVVTGIGGLIAVVVYCLRKKRPDLSLSALVYLGLTAYVFLLIPWGSQSYLLSATAPLLMCALFPAYDWFRRRGGAAQTAVSAVIMILLGLVFAGNIVPSISRMADIGGAVKFVCNNKNQTAGRDIYFVPPPYSEAAFAIRGFSAKNVVFVQEGNLTPDFLSREGTNYILFNDLFPSVHLAGTKTGEEVFANPTWRIMTLEAAPGHDENFSVPFPKSAFQRLKARIRDL